MSSSNYVTLPSDQNIVKYLLECPVCSDYMTGKVCLCVMGHSICGDCHSILLRMKRPCPLCRKPLNSQAARNFVVERFIASCKFKCKYADVGCKQEIEGFMYNIHVQECHLRDFACNLFGFQEMCSEIPLKYKYFISHLLQDHNIPLFSNGSWIYKTFKNEAISPSLVLIQCSDQFFFFYTRRFQLNPCSSFQISYDKIFIREVFQLEELNDSNLVIADKDFRYEILTDSLQNTLQSRNEEDSTPRNASFKKEPIEIDLHSSYVQPLSMLSKAKQIARRKEENSLFGFNLNGEDSIEWKEKITISITPTTNGMKAID